MSDPNARQLDKLKKDMEKAKAELERSARRTNDLLRDLLREHNGIRNNLDVANWMRLPQQANEALQEAAKQLQVLTHNTQQYYHLQAMVGTKKGLLQ